MSNDRDDLEARIAAYIDGELPSAEAARLEVFLANADPQLAEQVIGMLGDRHQLRALPKARAPEDLAARIVEQVERSTLLNNVEHFHTHHRPWWQSRAALAAGVLLVLGGFTYFILQALHTANPAWQAAVETASHPAPSIAAAPESVPPAIASAPPMKSADRAATTSPESAENAPMLAAAGSAAPAAQLANPINEPPVQLTLVAQSPDDVARLHAALETLLASDTSADRSQPFAPAARFPKAALRTQTTQPADDRQNSNLQQSQMNNENIQTPTPTPPQNNVASIPQIQNDSPHVYHLTLRPAQVAQLTQQFHVQTLTRGDHPYTLPNSSPEKKDAPDARPAGHDLPEAAATAPSSSTDTTPIECVITIVPAPAATAPATH